MVAVRRVPEHWACSCANLHGGLRRKVWSDRCVAGDRGPSILGRERDVVDDAVGVVFT